MLNIDQLEKLIEELSDFIRERVTLANRTGELESLIQQWEAFDIFDKITIPQDLYETQKEGKIIILGESAINQNEISGIAKTLGLNKDRFEYCLDYEEVKNYNYSKLQYEPKYRLVLVGPMPHKTSGSGGSSSVIAEMEKTIGYPKVVRLSSNSQLKITKTNLKEALKKQIELGYI